MSWVVGVLACLDELDPFDGVMVSDGGWCCVACDAYVVALEDCGSECAVSLAGVWVAVWPALAVGLCSALCALA